MAYFFSPIGNTQIFDANGDPLVGGTISTFLAGTSTTETTYTDDTGGTQQGVVMTLNSLGYPTNGPVWLLGGVPLKFIIKNAAGVTQSTFDDVSGIGDTASAVDEWTLYGAAPTYISATSFSVVGDQTNAFQVNRRTKTTNSGGTIYSRISASAYTTLTTVTVVNDSGVLDSGLSAVSYGLLSATNPSIPETTVGKALRIATSEGVARDALLVPAAFRSYLSGFTMSTAGSSATMSIAAGAAADSTNVTSIIGSAIAKTTSAWAVGTAQGGLDTGAIANSTWYHFYAIRRPDTGVVDVVFSTNATTPTLPTNYTQYRRIGSAKTNGSAQWILFFQNGDLFQWDVEPLDISVSNPGTSSVLRTLSTPLGIKTIAIIRARAADSGLTSSHRFSDPQTTDIAASASGAPGSDIGANSVAGEVNYGRFEVQTDTSSRIRSTAVASGANTALQILTLGYIDRRGRDA